MELKPYYAPHSIDVDITTHCNLRCSYCSHFSSDGDVDKDLSLDEWSNFFAECGSIGIMKITLGGGEPFFRKDTSTSHGAFSLTVFSSSSSQSIAVL